MSPDWAAKPATVPYAEFGDPQSLNLYSYTRNSPIIRVDGDGHDANGMLARPGQAGILGASDAAGGDSGGTNEFRDAEINAYIDVLNQRAQQQQTQPQQAHTTGEGSQANLDRRAAIATTAQKHDGDTSMPYTPGHPTCNLFVQKDIAEAGAPKPEVTKADGSKARRAQRSGLVHEYQVGESWGRARSHNRATLLRERKTSQTQRDIQA